MAYATLLYVKQNAHFSCSGHTTFLVSSLLQLKKVKKVHNLKLNEAKYKFKG